MKKVAKNKNKKKEKTETKKILSIIASVRSKVERKRETQARLCFHFLSNIAAVGIFEEVLLCLFTLQIANSL